MQKNRIYMWLLSTFLLLLFSCGRDKISGGSEVGNPNVAGIVRDSNGLPVEGATVRMVPRGANPVTLDSTKIDIAITDENGLYHISDVPTGEYNLVIKKTTSNLGTINNTLDVGTEDTIWKYDTLSKMGSIMLSLDKDDITEDTYIYFEGTDFFSTVSAGVELENGKWGVLLDEIPVHDDLELFFFDTAQNSILLDSMLTIIPDDTITINIFDARIVYHQGNSGIPNNQIYRVETDKDGTLWALTFDMQLGYFDGAQWKKSNPQGAETIGYIEVDASNNFFVATKENGLMQYTGTDWIVVADTCPFLVEGMVIDEVHGTWAISQYALYRWDFSANKWDLKVDFPSYITDSAITTTLKLTPEGTLWIGTSHGLVTIKDDVISYYDSIDDLYTPWITALEVGSDGTLWIGTDFGVYSYSNETFSNVDISGQMWDVVSLFRDSQGVLWCGTGWDGFLLKLENQKWEIFDIYAFELNAYIGAILSITEKGGHLFVGTELTGVVEIWDSPGGESVLK